MRNSRVARSGTTTILLSSMLACGSGGGADAGPGPDPGVPSFFGGTCTHRDCELERAGTIFTGLDGERMWETAMAIVRDADGDHYDEIAIGDATDGTTGAGNGIVRLFFGIPGVRGHLSIGRADRSWTIVGWRVGLGSSIGALADLDGDGRGDFVAGGPGWQGAGIAADGLAVIFMGGPADPGGCPTPLELTHGSCGFGTSTLRDGSTVGSAGSVVASAGDIDGDGRTDVLVGAPLREDEAGRGAVYVYLAGRPSSSTGPSLGPRLDTVGLTIRSDAGAGGLGTFAASAGDVDGDGYGDFLLGAQRVGAGGEQGVLLVYGRPDPFEGLVGASAIAAASLVAPAGTAPLEGRAAGAGDIDGDGYDDFLLGVSAGGPTVAWVVYGRAERFAGAVDVSTIGVALTADAATGLAEPHALAGVGDVDADGLDDFVVGDPDNTAVAAGAGAVWVWLGRSERLAGAVALSAADARLVGPSDADPCTGRAGTALAGGGDVNWDGYDDFLVGAAGDGSPGCGIIYVVDGARR